MLHGSAGEARSIEAAARLKPGLVSVPRSLEPHAVMNLYSKLHKVGNRIKAK